MPRELSRRSLLGLSVAGVAVGSGCIGLDDSTDSSDATDDTETTDSSDGSETDAASADETSDGENETDGAADADDETTVHEDYETSDVTIVSPDDTERGSVTAAIADTGSLQRLGLSDTESLPSDRGMLFVYDRVSERTFVMREMDFGIDIIYADADGTITEIHHAPEPGPDEDGNDQRYPGRGQYVLEVTYEWTTEHDVSEGDVLEFELPDE